MSNKPFWVSSDKCAAVDLRAVQFATFRSAETDADDHEEDAVRIWFHKSDTDPEKPDAFVDGDPEDVTSDAFSFMTALKDFRVADTTP